jgi:cardiolipin synthase
MIDLKKEILKIKEKILLLNIKIFFNIPNILTFTRILLIIPFSISLLSENYIKACKILIFSGITDFLDGFFARILHQQTKLGAILDPIADKLTLISIMVCLSIKFKSIVYFMIILIIKELCMLLVGAFMLKKTKKDYKSQVVWQACNCIFLFFYCLNSFD